MCITDSLTPHVGPHTEYHFIKEAQAKGAWVMTAFQSRWTDTAWRITYPNPTLSKHESDMKVMRQSIESKAAWTHPMLVAGDSLWRDYTLEVRLSPHSTRDRTGIIFRYRNDRCYY